METADDLEKLEALLAAENSEEESEPSSVKKSLISTDDINHGFLKDVAENEANVTTKKSGKFRNCDSSVLGRSTKTKIQNENSLVHNGDTDSSDDEDKRNFLETKYSEYGSDIKGILKRRMENEYNSNILSEPLKNNSVSVNNKIAPAGQKSYETKNVSKDVYSDPVFGIRITKPLISSAVLLERMNGREAIGMNRVKRHVANGDVSKDWVIAGAIVRKSASKESQKGSQYCIWTLSDLKSELKTVALFLFRSAYKQHWKVSEGTVVGVLNPAVLDKRDNSNDEACLSVDNADKIMIFGNSKDFGFCKSRKKNGDQCGSFVNTNHCEYCVYHVKQEYKKFSHRPGLQSITGGRGLADITKKVFGKNTLIYGGKEYSAMPAVKNFKQINHDKSRLQTLSGYFQPEQQGLMVNKSPALAPVKKMASRVEWNSSQRRKDLERLESLKGGPAMCTKDVRNGESSPILSNNTNHIIDKSASSETHNVIPHNLSTFGTPTLGISLKKTDQVDLNITYNKKRTEKVKANALKWIQQNGPIKKSDPNNVRGTEEGRKRNLSKLNSSFEGESSDSDKRESKRSNSGLDSEFKKMMEASSSHADLIIQHDDLESEKYFNKLEKKESMEEKMLNTFKVSCKAVRCLKCGYTSFSAADRCKQERHPLKVFDAVKRFFKCKNCSNRQVSLEVIPTNSCKNCQMSTWQRTGMIAEKKVTAINKLSITGEEEFLGEVSSGANINMLVPEN